MDTSVTSTIEKIKLEEKDKEAKLKEKREIEATAASLTRAIRDFTSQSEKYEQEYTELVKITDELSVKYEMEKNRRDTLAAHIKAIQAELKELAVKSNQGISEVWKMRSFLCDAVQFVANECDVWALLIKPTSSDPIPKANIKSEEKDIPEPNEERLKKALERHKKALTERSRLLAEPEEGEEFLRSDDKQRYGLSVRCFTCVSHSTATDDT